MFSKNLDGNIKLTIIFSYKVHLILKKISKICNYNSKHNKEILKCIKKYHKNTIEDIALLNKYIFKEKEILKNNTEFSCFEFSHYIYMSTNIETNFYNLSDEINQVLSSIDVGNFNQIIDEEIIKDKKEKKYDINIDIKSLYEIIYQIDFEKSPKPVLDKKLMLDLVENGQSYFDHNWDKLNVYVDNLANIKGKTVGQVCKELSIVSALFEKLGYIIQQASDLERSYCYLSEHYADYVKNP